DICPSLKDFQLSGTSGMDLSFLKRFHNKNDGDEDMNNANGGGDTGPLRVFSPWSSLSWTHLSFGKSLLPVIAAVISV
ncbi:hypothetical protein BGX34_008633, partial [Mortierella sp. NVP85]